MPEQFGVDISALVSFAGSVGKTSKFLSSVISVQIFLLSSTLLLALQNN